MGDDANSVYFIEELEMTANQNSPNEELKAVRSSKGKKSQDRQFYRFDNSNPSGAIGLEFFNKATLLPPGGVSILCPPDHKTGFREYPEIPTFRFDRKKGRAPRDMEMFHDYWLVSERLKNVLEAVDPEGVVFLKCRTILANGDVGPSYWLLDVVRILDALDLQKSVPFEGGCKAGDSFFDFLVPTPGVSAFFKESVVGSAHIFRLPGQIRTAICDDVVREACRAANIKGADFRNTVNRSK
jgi:hypothetical protein